MPARQEARARSPATWFLTPGSAKAIPPAISSPARLSRTASCRRWLPKSLVAPDLDSGLLTREETLAGLAQKIGVDVDGLAETIKRFNANARRGEDPDFGRGATEHDRYYADHKVEPNPCLGPLEEPPFYALRVDAGDLDTKGGLKCDEFGRVLNERDEPIAGLYAAGNTSAAVMGDTYPGAGATIASAMTFGYIAACHAFEGESAGGSSNE